MKRQKAGKIARSADTDDSSGTAQKSRINQVDLLKGLAIISVILIHIFPIWFLTWTGAPFYLWQAVPVFLLLAAFTGSLAYKSQKRKNLADCYDPSLLIRRYKRILLPFALIWILQLIVILFIIPPNFPLDSVNVYSLRSGIPEMLANFFSGGSGPGNYFIPVILQQIIILPVFYWLAVRFSPDRMLIIAFMTNIALEFSLVLAGVPPGIYGILYVPYFMAGAAGVWLAFQSKKIVPGLIVAGIASAGYIAAVFYFNFHLWFIDTNGFFNVFSYFWTLLLVAAGLHWLSSQSVTIQSRTVRELGRASWHIFLVQMTFFLFFKTALVNAINTAIPGTGLLHSLVCLSVMTIPSLGICLLSGYGFYLTEERAKIWMGGKQ
jgi:peptidoglycan/LPS O-acetylase OafA/YrhL